MFIQLLLLTQKFYTVCLIFLAAELFTIKDPDFSCFSSFCEPSQLFLLKNCQKFLTLWKGPKTRIKICHNFCHTYYSWLFCRKLDFYFWVFSIAEIWCRVIILRWISSSWEEKREIFSQGYLNSNEYNF